MNQTSSTEASRDAVIIRTSIIGIAANLFLAAFKAVVGLLSNSIAVILDAVNNLSDALSSVVTIIGTRLASRQPDKKHPLGHGRTEYLSAMVVAAIVLYAGITSLAESVKKILRPETPDYSVTSLVIIAAAVIVKILLGRYVKRTGERVGSGSLVASGSDATFDAVLSASVLVSAVIFLVTGISLEAFVGAVIAGFIIKAGVEMLLETLDDIIGHRESGELTRSIKEVILAEPEVHGVYDLILHDYGPDRHLGSVHVSVEDVMTADRFDALTRRLMGSVLQKTGVILTAVGLYAINTKDDEVSAMQTKINEIIHGHDGVLQTHGFYVDKEKQEIFFDLVLDFAVEDRKSLFHAIRREIEEAFPNWKLCMTMDIDVSD